MTDAPTVFLCPAGNPLVMDDYVYALAKGGKGKYRGLWLHAGPWNRGLCQCAKQWPPSVAPLTVLRDVSRRLAMEAGDP